MLRRVSVFRPAQCPDKMGSYTVKGKSLFVTAGMALAALYPMSACADMPQASAAISSQTASAQSRLPAEGWWHAYGDPQLDTLIEAGLKDGADVRIATARLEEARAVEYSSHQLNFPTLSATAQAQQLASGKDSGTTHADGLGLGLLNFGWDIDFWGRNRAILTQSRDSRAAAEADVAAARLMLSTAIASAYIDLQRYYDGQDLADTQVSIETQTLQLVQARFDHGLASRIELDQTKATLQATKDNVYLVADLMAAGRNRLAALIGQKPEFGTGLTRPRLKATSLSALPETLDIDLIGRRPDVRAARLRAEAASARIDQAKAAFYPNISLSALAAAITLKGVTAGGSDFTVHQNVYGAGPAISLPIFDRGRLKSGLLQSRAEHDAAVATYDNTLNHAFEDTADSLSTRKIYLERIQAAQDGVNAASEALKLTKQRYRAGIAGLDAVLNAERLWLSRENQLSDLSTRALLADIALIKALGGAYQ